MEPFRSHRKSSTNATPTTLPVYRSFPPLEFDLYDFELYAIDRIRGSRF